jgi:hypothetical protein
MSDEILASFLAPLSDAELVEIHRDLASEMCCVICVTRKIALRKLQRAIAACPCQEDKFNATVR